MAKRFLRIHLLLVAALILPLPNQAGIAQTGAPDDFHLYLPLITNLGEGNLPPGPLPTVDVKVNGSDGPVTLTDQDSFSVSWTSAKATACTGSGAMAGRTGLSGSFTDGPKANGTYSYSMTCTNGQGQQASDPVTVTVVEPLPIESRPITAGGYHTCALTPAGGAKCWGDNRYGQLGDGASDISSDSPTPDPVVGLSSGVSGIGAGRYHTCALTQTGGAKCWGDNYYGQLGDGTSGNESDTPVQVVGLSSGVSAIAAGDGHTCAMTQTGEIYCWGGNGDGELGIGDYTSGHSTPVQAVGLPGRVSAIAAGGSHTCALTQAGGVYCWGENEAGELGDGATTTSTPTPVQVIGLASGVIAIAAGDDHTCALTSAGGVKCWGDNDFGQLGNGKLTDSPTPVQVVGLASGVTAIVTGEDHTCALTQAGGVKCWGDGGLGALGDGGWSYSSSPVDVSGLASGVTAIAAGDEHTCALTQAGGAKCWGWNEYGQLGTGIYRLAWVPEDVVGFP